MRQAASRPEAALRRDSLYGSSGGFEKPLDFSHPPFFQGRMDRKAFNFAETEFCQGARTAEMGDDIRRVCAKEGVLCYEFLCSCHEVRRRFDEAG